MKAEDQSAEREALLKPCPFCEGAAELSEFTSLGSGITTCTVACSGCAAASDIFLIEEKDQAIAAWNRRPAPPAAKAVEMDADKLRKEIVNVFSLAQAWRNATLRIAPIRPEHNSPCGSCFARPSSTWRACRMRISTP